MEAVPWGKIELGLPKWHHKQRDKEEATIDERLGSPLVTYVPSTKLGRDVTLEELLGWGFDAILLAIGAWKDRPLPVPGIDAFENRGLIYQNPFVAQFNQYHSPDYNGPSLEIQDDAMVVGGGLASLDVVKILMLETTARALRQRGLKADLFALEKKGIPKILQQLGVSWEELGLKGCTLYYRRRAQDMPLIPMDDSATPEKLEKAKSVREKLLSNFLSKYLFRFEPCCMPVRELVGEDRLAGLVFQRTEVREGRAVPLPNTEFEVRSPQIISSIGSLPDPIPGIELKWQLFRIPDSETGKLEGFDNVFALGNAVTGTGNIRASRLHARAVAEWVLDNFLQSLASVSQSSSEETRLEKILELASELQARAGYDGDYDRWIERHRPIRLESMESDSP
jgi:NADPH-dependent glutamate synthase beta subunit-like oxidoreductase